MIHIVIYKWDVEECVFSGFVVVERMYVSSFYCRNFHIADRRKRFSVYINVAGRTDIFSVVHKACLKSGKIDMEFFFYFDFSRYW